jgi:anthranilate/para-aminobenzoate synthase component I
LERDPRLPAVWLGRYREPHRGRLLVGFDGGEAEPRPSLTWTEDRWRDAVASVRERIANGDCYQVNLARPVSWSGSVDPWRAALRLRRVTDAARGAFLRLSPELAVLSASPERLLDVVGDLVVSVPIKGTRPFGDPGARDELLGSAKDRAELAMIVDLVRHDLSAACAVGSVRSRARRVARHATVWHAHQPVRGCIAPGCEPWEVLERLLPAGSVTGAPKRRVIQRIAELEGAPRGFSYGAIGWMSAHEGQWSVAIRTAVIRPNDGWFHVGGGITWASEAEDEWRETIAKSRALARALLGVEVA